MRVTAPSSRSAGRGGGGGGVRTASSLVMRQSGSGVKAHDKCTDVVAGIALERQAHQIGRHRLGRGRRSQDTLEFPVVQHSVQTVAAEQKALATAQAALMYVHLDRLARADDVREHMPHRM